MGRGVGVLALFILLRGSDSSLLKWLQIQGSAAAGAGQPISFCNVFFFSSLVTGLAILFWDRRGTLRRLPSLTPTDRRLLVTHSFTGFFLAPMAYYLALEQLSVVQQTLLFSLTVPCTALVARFVLKESLPRLFPLSCGLITLGLLLSARAGAMADSPGMALDGRGVAWACVGIAAFAWSGVNARLLSQKSIGVGLTIGVSSLMAAQAFAVIAIVLFGPSHFIALSRWWVLGVIGGYACLVTLGSQWSLMQAYACFGVVTVTVWATLTLVVSLVVAHGLLAEPLSPMAIGAAALIVLAVLVQQWSPMTRPAPEAVSR